MPEWKLDVVPVLNRLRDMSRSTMQWEPNEQEQAAIDKVWSFVGVDIGEYGGPSKPWTGVERGRREEVRQRLRDGFDEAAFVPRGRAARDTFTHTFTRPDLLAWGHRLLADAEAAAEAANAAMAAANSAADAAAAAAAAEAAAAEPSDDPTDEASTGTSTDTAMDVMLAHLPAGDHLTIERIIERFRAEGYEGEDRTELVRYAQTHYVLRHGDYGAVDSAMDMFGGLALDLPAPPSDEDLTESSVRTRSDRPVRHRPVRRPPSTYSDESNRTFETRLSAQMRKSDFAFMSRALLKLESDLHAGRIKLDQIHREMGLKKTNRKLQKAGKVIKKETGKVFKKIGKTFGR